MNPLPRLLLTLASVALLSLPLAAQANQALASDERVETPKSPDEPAADADKASGYGPGGGGSVAGGMKGGMKGSAPVSQEDSGDGSDEANPAKPKSYGPGGGGSAKGEEPPAKDDE